jgi:glycosyltransferase involved in cell wall biosynthesis
MKFSLITTLYNEEKSILEFINSINNQTEFPDEFIVVDGGSTDDTVAILNKELSKDLNFKIIVDKNCTIKYSKGPIAKGRNVAILNTSHEYILVTDAGCILDNNWIKEMKKSFIEGQADIVSGWYTANVTNDFQKEIADIFCPSVKSINKNNFLPSSRSLGFKKYLWKKVEGYPENSYTAEDTLFDLKIFALTNKIVFNEKAFVYWEVPKDNNELVTKLYQYGYGEGQQKIFLMKNFLRLSFLIFFPILLLLILAGKKKPSVFKFYFYQIKGFIKGFIDG